MKHESDGCGSTAGAHEFFDSVAEEWQARGFTSEELPKVERLHERLGDVRNLRILEPGCGAGRLTAFLAQWVGPGGRVTAVDNSPVMAAAAHAAVAGLGPAEVFCENALVHTTGPASVDLVILFSVFPHFRDQQRALGHFRSMLRPGGRLVIAHLTGSEILNRMHRELGEPVCHDQIPERSLLVQMIQGAGYVLREFIDDDGEFYLEAAAESPSGTASPGTARA